MKVRDKSWKNRLEARTEAAWVPGSESHRKLEAFKGL